MEVLGTPGLLELGGRTRDTERAAPIQQKLVKVRNEDPESTTKQGLEEQHRSSDLSFAWRAGKVTSGEGRKPREWFSWRKTVFLGRWLCQPARITNLFGNPCFMASEKVILLVTAQKDWLK